MYRVTVLDHGWIELEDVMGTERSIAEAARTSSSNFATYAPHQSAQDDRLVTYLYEHRHTSPFEMVELKFRIRAPMMVFNQWVRHRTASINSESARYHQMECEFYIPAIWRTQNMQNRQSSAEDVERTLSLNFSEKLQNYCNLGYDLYEEALQAGVAREQARLFLPGYALYTQWVWKVNLKNLLHFLGLRMASEAQEEIRVYAHEIAAMIVPLFPTTMRLFMRDFNAGNVYF